MSKKKRKSKTDLVSKGLKYFKSENYSEASKCFEKAAKNSSDSRARDLAAEACYRNALSLYETESINYAISELHRAIQNNSDKPIYYYHLGLAYHKKERTDKAIPCYLKAIEKDENNDRFKYHLALAYLDEGKIERANAVMEKISDSEKYSINLISDQMMALTLIKQGNYKEALKALKGLNDEYASFLRGVAYIYLKKRREAKSSLREAIKRGFDNAIAHYHLGVAYAMSDNKFSATKSWEKAIKVDPNITKLVKPGLMNVYRELAAEYVLQKDALPKAVRIWKKMLKLEPENSIASNNLVRFYFLKANNYVEEDELSRAVSNWNSILELEPNNTEALHNIALAYDKTGRTYESIEYWEELIKKWEKNIKIASSEEREKIKKQLAVAYKHIGKIYMNIDQIGNAAKNLRRASNYDEEDVQIKVQLAELYAYMEQRSRAIRELKKALELEPNDAELYNMLAMIYDEDGKKTQAINALLDAFKIAPENKIVRQNLLRYTNEFVAELMKEREGYRAVEVLKDVIGYMSDEPSLYVILGGVYLDTGNTVEAEKVFQKAIDIDPNNGLTYAAVGRFYLEISRKKASELYQKAMERANGDASVPVEIGRGYCINQQPQMAEEYFDIAIEYKPDEDTFMSIIMFLISTNHTEMANKYIQKAVEMLSQPVPIILMGAITFAENGDSDKVDEYMELATELAYESGDQKLIDMVREVRFSINLSSMMFGFEDVFEDDFEDDEGWFEDDEEGRWI